MAAQRFVKARLAIGAGVAAAVIGGSGYFYQTTDLTGGADANATATSAASAPQVSSTSRDRSQAAQSSTARRSRAS